MSQTGGSGGDGRSAFDEQLRQHQQLINELRGMVYGDQRYGSDGLKERVRSLEGSVSELQRTHELEQVERKAESRKRDRRDKWVLSVSIALIGAVGAVLAALVQVLG